MADQNTQNVVSCGKGQPDKWMNRSTALPCSCSFKKDGGKATDKAQKRREYR